MLASFTYADGNKYGDFNPEIDEVAAWTIGGLVAGKVLAKAGLLAAILKFWKLIAIGLVAAGSFVWRLIRGKKREQELVQEAVVERAENSSVV